MAQAVAWELVRQAAAGQADARRALVEATLDDLWALAMRLVRRQDEAETIVQETYARAFAALGGLTPAGRFEGFLARVATNLVLERWRRRRPTADVSEVDAASSDAEPWQTAADKEEHGRLLAAAWQAIQDLSPEPRAAMLLFYAQEQSCRQVAEVMDVPVGTVKTWLHRARNQVRQDAERILHGSGAAQP
ncbi:MAG: sigma-70 family RNA polymerase sigma factor [Planctomycetes bacterium]|nr:sigma-70 family RNA polymerase sigma factor [Planctomycetota bacterium]